MRIAIVHEWLDGYAGSEQVVEQMLEVFSTADVFALVDFLPAEARGFLEGRNVRTSFLQRLPLARKRFRAYLPLMPLAIEQFDLSDYQIILSSNHAVAKGALTREDQLHLCYVHTPIRYAWDLYHATLKINGLQRGPKSWLTRLLLHYVRLWDHASASRVDGFAANSRYVARRVWKTYRRRAAVIYPPVDVERFCLQRQKSDFYLTVSRLVPYKRVDLIVEAFRRMPDKRLIVIGDGPQRGALERHVPPNVTILGHQPARVVEEHMQAARAFVYAADEDFGISPVEAQACGTPVIAFGRGGVTETVLPGKTGVFFPEQTATSITSAVEAFEECRAIFEPEFIRDHAAGFSTERFQKQFAQFVDRRWERFQRQATRSFPAARPAKHRRVRAPLPR